MAHSHGEHNHDHSGSGHSHGGSEHSHGGHGHSHGPSLARAGARHIRPLTYAFVIIGVFFVVEAVAGLWTNSLALLSDAGHMLTDVIGLGMALAAITLANRHEQRKAAGETTRNTFGLYRLEILAAFVNSLLLFGVAIYVMIEAVGRLFGGESEVVAGPMLVVAVLGLAANGVAFALLREGSKDSLNMQGAYLEVLADAIGSVGVIIAGVALQLFGWSWVDPVVAVAIGVWILPRSWKLGGEAVRVLLQAAPASVDLDALHQELAELPGVVEVHDLHVWTLTSEMEAMSAHLMCDAGVDHHQVLDRARELVGAGYGIDHATFQVEPNDHTGCHEVSW